jgi:hypothetical protein
MSSGVKILFNVFLVFGLCAQSAASDTLAGWTPVSIVTIGRDEFVDARGQAVSVLRDFPVSEEPTLGTLDALLVTIRLFGRLPAPVPNSASEKEGLRRVELLLNGNGDARRFVLRRDYRDLRSSLRGEPVAIDRRGKLLSSFVRLDGQELVAANVIRDMLTSGELSLDSSLIMREVLETPTADYFLDDKLVQFDLQINGGTALWDQFSIEVSSKSDLPLTSLFSRKPHNSFGTIAVAHLPVTLAGITPNLLRSLRFPDIDEESRKRLPKKIKIPTGFIVVQNLCVTCLQHNTPALPLPLTSWTKMLLEGAKDIFSSEKTIAIVGVAYEEIDFLWRR